MLVEGERQTQRENEDETLTPVCYMTNICHFYTLVSMLQGRMMNYYKVKREHVCVYVYQENGHLVVALERHRASHQRQRSLYTFALFTERVVLEQNTTLRTRFGCRESNLLWQGV